jgi:hypothetical protein
LYLKTNLYIEAERWSGKREVLTIPYTIPRALPLLYLKAIEDEKKVLTQRKGPWHNEMTTDQTIRAQSVYAASSAVMFEPGKDA